MQLTFNICSWGAWSPHYQQAADWKHWSESSTHLKEGQPLSPKLSQVPAMQRRRYSSLTKMQLEAAFQCNPPTPCRSIFASRHGELHRTIGLLDNLVEQEPLSPTAFSQSVHNTASGIFSILTGDQSPSTSIAAGEETLFQAFIEAYAQLQQDSSPLMLVFGDELVPERYSQFTDEYELPISMAFSLSQTQAQGMTLTITREENSTLPLLSYGALLNGLANRQAVSGILSQHIWTLSFG
ncbi:beta-ketoacyl synthase chain length factor [Shewanella hanedai]|uniref:Beta-ketoacyl synthase chain length factor n=1 Tax=Shewanella hanedai TaxID=25 RepID=A0A553JR02_SHEHA|nr:beta-ketoacyl synthase chain length factor [Shewanella hanedai]TRY14887.1 beta-ketoacyl synthase chain length factor [Shewanella hanedai]